MSKCTFVWRLEDLDGNGIFRGDIRNTGIRYATYIDPELGVSTKRHPSPLSDNKLMKATPFHGKKFGFNDLSQFRSWFFKKEWRERMVEVGIYLCKYKVPKSSVWKGDTQAVFIPEDAVLIERRFPNYID